MKNLIKLLFVFALMLDTCLTTTTYVMVPTGVPTPIPRPSIVLEESYGEDWGAKALFVGEKSEFREPFKYPSVSKTIWTVSGCYKNSSVPYLCLVSRLL